MKPEHDHDDVGEDDVFQRRAPGRGRLAAPNISMPSPTMERSMPLSSGPMVTQARRSPTSEPEGSRRMRLREDLGPDAARRHAEGEHQADLPHPLEDGHDQGVDEAEGQGQEDDHDPDQDEAVHHRQHRAQVGVELVPGLDLDVRAAAASPRDPRRPSTLR